MSLRLCASLMRCLGLLSLDSQKNHQAPGIKTPMAIKSPGVVKGGASDTSAISAASVMVADARTRLISFPEAGIVEFSFQDALNRE